MTGVIVVTGVIAVVKTRLEVISDIEDTLHVEREAVIEETVADPRTVDVIVFDETKFGVKDEVRVTTDELWT